MSNLPTVITDDEFQQQHSDLGLNPLANYPYIGFTFSPYSNESGYEVYDFMREFCEYCDTNLMPVFLEQFIEMSDDQYPVNSVGEQFARWFFANEFDGGQKQMQFLYKKTGEDTKRATFIIDRELTDTLRRSVQFNPTGDFVWTERTLARVSDIIDDFKVKCKKTMPTQLFNWCLEKNYFGVNFIKHL
jgi:isocitrate lyase